MGILRLKITIPEIKNSLDGFKSRERKKTQSKMYAPNKRISKYIQQKLIELKGEINKSIVTVGDLLYHNGSYPQLGNKPQWNQIFEIPRVCSLTTMKPN